MLSSRISSIITVIVLMLNLGMYFYTQKGLILFIPFTSVACIALVLWLTCNTKINLDNVFISFILVVIGLVVLNMLRYLAGFASVGSILFNAAFLFGGYLLLNRAPIGIYIAWYISLWSIFQGLLQFYMAYALKANYINYYYLGLCAGIATLVLGLNGLYRLFCINCKLPIINFSLPDSRIINLWTAFCLNIAVLYSIIIFSSQPYITPDLVLFWLSLICGIILWRKTIVLDLVNVQKLVQQYLLMLGLYMLYSQETDFTQYEEHLAILFKINLPFPQIYSIKLIFMLLGAILLYLRKPIGKLIVIIVCFYFIFSGFTVFVLFPMIEAIRNSYHFHYFPGMWTALLPVIPALCIIIEILQKPQLTVNNDLIK